MRHQAAADMCICIRIWIVFVYCEYTEAVTCATPIRGHRGSSGYGRFAPIHLNTARPLNTASTPQYGHHPSIQLASLQYRQHPQYGSNTAATNVAGIDLGPLKIALPAIASNTCADFACLLFMHIVYHKV